jgi:hypothetical protein
MTERTITSADSLNRLSDFGHGVLYAAAIVQATARMPTLAADILREAGLVNADCAELDDYDKQHLRVVNEETGMNLKNL